jgi:hypothetical protein
MEFTINFVVLQPVVSAKRKKKAILKKNLTNLMASLLSKGPGSEIKIL